MALLCSIHVRLLYRTCRLVTPDVEIERGHLDRERPVIACFWHGGLFVMAVFCLAARRGALPAAWPAARPLRILVSPRRQGRFFSLALRWLGVGTIVGAAGPGGASFARTILEALSAGQSILIAPDGPRGPRGHAAPAVIRLARLAGVPVVPIGCASSLCRVLSTWDRLIAPVPFARLTYVFGEAIEVPRAAQRQAIEAGRRSLEDRLTAVTAEAHRWCGRDLN